MSKNSKRIEFLRKYVAELGAVDLPTAIKELKGLEGRLPDGVKPCRIDQTSEIAIRLGVDPKQADQLVRGSIVLPHGIGKFQRVVVARVRNISVAEEAGADAVGGKELADRIKGGWLDFDVTIATPDMMVLWPARASSRSSRLCASPKAGQ